MPRGGLIPRREKPLGPNHLLRLQVPRAAKLAQGMRNALDVLPARKANTRHEKCQVLHRELMWQMYVCAAIVTDGRTQCASGPYL